MKTIEEKERLNRMYGKISLAAGPEDDTPDELGGLDPESNEDDEGDEEDTTDDDDEPVEDTEDEA